MNNSKNNQRRSLALSACISLIGAAAFAVFTWAAPETAAANGGFVQSCSGIGNFGSRMLANCKRQDGSVNKASVELGPFIANDNGQLVRAEGGGFDKSCSDIAVAENGVLQAACRRRDGNIQFSRLDLNQFVVNNNGELGFAL